MKKFKITKGDRVYIVDAKSHIDAINKVKSIKDAKFWTEDREAGNRIEWFSTAREAWNAIKKYEAEDKKDGTYTPDFYNVTNDERESVDENGKVRDSAIKDGSIDYGTLTIDLNSPNELTSSKIVQELKSRIGNDKIAEIRGGSFIPLREYGSASLELDFKEFRYNNWGTNSITLAVSYTVPAMDKALKNDPKYGAYKLRTELNNKLKQFANKTIYSNKSFTMDSKINDIDEYKKNYAAAMRAAGEKAKKDQINSDIQKLYDIAKQYGPVRTEQHKFNVEFEHQNMQVVLDRFYNDKDVKRVLKQLEDLDTKWNAIVDKYKFWRHYRIPEEGPNRFIGSNTPTKKWVDEIKKQLLKDSAIKDEDYSKYLSIVKQLEKLVEPANRALQQKIEKYGVTKQDIRNNSPKYRDVCREIPELKVWAKLIMQLPGVLQGTMSAYPSQESVDKLKKVVTNGKAFDSTIKDSYGWSYIMAPMKTPGDKDLNILRNLRSTYYDDMYQDVYNIRKAFAKATNKRVAINMAKDMPEYAKFIRTLDSADKDWNAIISKYPSLKKFKINTTGAERLLYGYYPTLKDFVDEITPVIKKEW